MMSGSPVFFPFVPPFPPLLWECCVFICLVVVPCPVLEVGSGYGRSWTLHYNLHTCHQSVIKPLSTHLYLTNSPSLHSPLNRLFCSCGIVLWLLFSVSLSVILISTVLPLDSRTPPLPGSSCSRLDHSCCQ